MKIKILPIKVKTGPINLAIPEVPNGLLVVIWFPI